MILVDTNLLVYAANRDAPGHARARLWLEDTLSGDTPVALSWLVIIAFVRLTTSPVVMSRPIAVDSALDFVDGWLHQPFVRILNPGELHWSILSRLLTRSGSAGNLTNDAHLAALAIEHGCTLYSADHDFKRFAGLKHVNPMEEPEIHEQAGDYV